MKTLSLKVPETLDQDLSQLAARRGKNKSSLIREVMQEHVDRQKNGHLTMASSSFLAQAQDLSGSIEGPEDLSIDPKYLKGYGR